ncbi:sulredoxin [Sulfolobus acidocaldarius]|uniref:Conserved Archaeal Rieske-type (2Fe-2S) protein n=4 Tax=Sulfolobus acidocaldarius TaxID=2285 RepID=Q4J7G6_SULAC|nr:sulredoxin [Sulfolobus acidocaldarius]AAY81266.1 conserved Archaeal Rieske-type (2Fe-2S) protein [Sulfolobus acidocaldarius DSM 639]AGE71896.1 Rieske-type (2Fe-2S) protein [Sulfolobus acidocaldarius N8]AGE74169.1 Rieske-type (2Fe-2S) protein [Sulfolobus acidocaldarius Ron12/I]ALU29929.1 sulredoxin [Sulfolobus acidocaldarius]ALU32672.1 sulredoxin [Sulfolobus acidocaldarius]
MVWKRTISAKALEKAKYASVKVEDKVIFMANIKGKLYAMDAVCSHARCILGQLDEEKLTVKCFCHHAVFDLNTGNMLEPPYVAPDAPKEKLGLKTYQIRDNSGWIEVDV